MSETKYIPTIGLEIHAELKTETKMFCHCKNNPDEKEPNKNICPICMGHPGTLPVINHEAVKHVLQVGLAIDAEIADYTEWDRKNYFYPDIPKGYQISQYKYPLVCGGKIAGVEITRIHLEEDTGTSIHDRGDFSLVNYNRAGVPLMELVTEPVIHSAKQAGDFARELQLLLRYLNVSEANMEKGEMRVEANISVGPADELEEEIDEDGVKKIRKILVPKRDENGRPIFGTKVEVKNLNSFKVAEKAIEYEIDRMLDLIEASREGEIVQETRGWDENRQKTFSQRKKETSDDYRYFPDPDLPKIKISEIAEFASEKLRDILPELPWQKRNRFEKIGLKNDQVEFLVANLNFAKFFDEVQKLLKDGDDVEKLKLAGNYITSDLVALYRNDENILEKVLPRHIADIVLLISENKISSRGAKDILAQLAKTEILADKDGKNENENNSSKNSADNSLMGQVLQIATEKGILQQSDTGALTEIVKKIIADNQKVADDYRAGKQASLQFLIGQAMKVTRGAANPQMLGDLFKKELL
jgi:aspartyl-tRNA(Asn)/glutamyl-tRNA(Gln) amidotransferase subunit B